MAIQRYSEGGNLERRVGVKMAAKKAIKRAAKKVPAKKHAAKHAAKKHAAKHAAKKHAAKHAQGDHLAPAHGAEANGDLGKAFHHLQRAAAVISLVDESGEDLRKLLDHGVRVYRIASAKEKKGAAAAALGLLRAAEHLSLAGLYIARAEHRPQLPVPMLSDTLNRLVNVRKRLEDLSFGKGENFRWLAALSAELVRRGLADTDPHLAWEYAAAADGLCSALEKGM